MKILGITGGVGAGKSTVLCYLQQRYGAALIQCDAVGAALQQPGGVCYQPMLRVLGDAYLQKDGTWNRAAIAAALFDDDALRAQINAIVHPAVHEEVKHLISKYTEEGRQLCVIEAALLLEANYDELCDEVWYVYADTDVRERRLIASRGYTPEKVHQIMAGQMSEEVFRSRCALTVDNSDENVQNTYDQMDKGLTAHGFLQPGQREQR